MSVRLTKQAELDLLMVVGATLIRFGSAQAQTYAKLISLAADRIAVNPEQRGSKPRTDLGPGCRSYGVALVGLRRRSASHVLFYVAGPTLSEPPDVVILRILHESMDPGQHVVITGSDSV